jgi:hypothetical protein
MTMIEEDDYSDEELEDIDTSQVLILLAPLVSKSLGKLVMIMALRQLFLRLKNSLE